MEEWQASEPYDGRMFCSAGCGTELTAEAPGVGVVLRKAVGAGDTPETAPIHLMYCRKCSLLPETL